jgi:hypothetical protein
MGQNPQTKKEKVETKIKNLKRQMLNSILRTQSPMKSRFKKSVKGIFTWRAV